MKRVFHDSFVTGLSWLAQVFILCLLIFSLIRLTFSVVYNNGQLQSINNKEIFQAFLTGFRFDIVVSCFSLSIPFLVLIILSLISRSEVQQIIYRKFLIWYCTIIFLALIFICLIDFYFYKFFQSHINILFFGIKDDDTKAVLSGIWADYPVIRVFLGLSILIIGIYYLLKYITKRTITIPTINRFIEGIILIGIIGLFIVGMRGSLGIFPLHYSDSILSNNSFINNISLNGVFALKHAFVEKKNQTITTDYHKTLHKYGYAEPNSAMKDYLQSFHPFDSTSLDLYNETPVDSFLINNPPHVVFIQMESFSNHYLDLHSQDFNLLGSLEDHIPDCIIFRNFLSATSGTIHSLEALVTGSPLTPLSQSIYLDCLLNSSVPLIYSHAGYGTNFITSGALGWRNMDKFAKNQGFQNSEGCEILLKKIPGTEKCDWGVFDESMFARILEILKESNHKPQFIYGLTTTNHTPFQLPSHYKLYPLTIPDSIKKFFKADETTAYNNFSNYQYANDCLGKFIAAVKNSDVGKNTIIAASGDHNTLQVFNYNDTMLHKKHSVPFILYIPEAYKKYTHIDKSVFGSHKDVFPTLFSISLSKSKYLKTGKNLLDSLESQDNFAIINYNLCMNRSGIVKFEHNPIFFHWNHSSYISNQVCNVNSELQQLYTHARSYCATMCYYIQSELKKCKE